MTLRQTQRMPHTDLNQPNALAFRDAATVTLPRFALSSVDSTSIRTGIQSLEALSNVVYHTSGHRTDT